MNGRSSIPLLAMMMGLALAGTAAANDQAAHNLAEKFAAGAEQEEADRKAAADAERQAADEAEMLERARTEAAERKAAADKVRAEDEVREAKRILEELRRAQEAHIAEQKQKRIEEEARVAEEQRRAEEARVAEQKRIDEEARVAEEQRRAEEARVAEQRRIEEEARVAEEQRRAEKARIAEQKRIEEEARTAEEQRRAEDARRKELAAEREAEHRRLTERLMDLEKRRQQRRELTETKQPLKDAPMTLGAPPPATVTTDKAKTDEAKTVETDALASTRVTILLVMDSGTNGIRRYGKKTADPVLCSGPTCWVSAGTDRTSTAMARGQALGPGNTLGRRAAACNHHLACAFRDIDLKAASASIQPIDLRIMRHDRRTPLTLEADWSCRLAKETLVCGKTYSGKTWRAWVVPEALAVKAGPKALEAALEAKLAAHTENSGL